MPLLNEPNMENHKVEGSTYGFSAVGLDTLGASEYTLVAIVVDVSGSVASFRDEIEDCVKTVVKTCQHSPRADNLMVRLVTFDDTVQETHGYKPLSEINVDDYNGTIRPGGLTALFDASQNAIASLTQYGQDLVDQDYEANAIVFVITDGADNRSTLTATEVAKALTNAVQSEALESIRSVLVGVDGSGHVDQYLQGFQKEAGFDQYVGIGGATESSLAKLADFVSRSISAQSQALGTGGPSQSLSF